jgi:starch synthase
LTSYFDLMNTMDAERSMAEKLRVLYVSPEISPFARSGELADVAQLLAKSLFGLGVEISLIMPKYRRPEIESMNLELVLPDLFVPLGNEKAKGNVHKAVVGRIPVYFIDNPKYFCRDMIYGPSKGEYLDNDERFTFFSRAVLEFLLKSRLPLDIIHCNNWPTALIPVFLRTHYAQKNHFKEVATVFSLHDIAVQGKFPAESLVLTGLSWDYFTPDQLALNGRFNFLKAGLIFSDVINAVSPTFREELLAADSGKDLEAILSRRNDAVVTVRNGEDEGSWELAAKEYIQIYRKALELRRGGKSG